MKQLAFLIVSSTPSLKKFCTYFKLLILAESTYFHRYFFFYDVWLFSHNIIQGIYCLLAKRGTHPWVTIS